MKASEVWTALAVAYEKASNGGPPMRVGLCQCWMALRNQEMWRPFVETEAPALVPLILSLDAVKVSRDMEWQLDDYLRPASRDEHFIVFWFGAVDEAEPLARRAVACTLLAQLAREEEKEGGEELQ